MVGLTFEVREDHLKDEGRLMLRCVASVGPAMSTQNSHHNFYQHQRNNPPPAASTISFGSFEPVDRFEPPDQANSNAVIETMEVRFIGKLSRLAGKRASNRRPFDDEKKKVESITLNSGH